MEPLLEGSVLRWTRVMYYVILGEGERGTFLNRTKCAVLYLIQRQLCHNSTAHLRPTWREQGRSGSVESERTLSCL
jgi:hypothetical protein